MDKIGQALVSVAEVKFFDPVTDYELGSAFALTSSGITSEMSSAEVRGGFMNQLLFDIKHTRSFSINFTSATFKPIYLAFQTGTDIVVGAKDVYVFNDCVTATNGAMTLSETPVGPVNIILPDQTIIDIAKPEGKDITVDSSVNGECICSYAYNDAQVSNIAINADTQPRTVKAVMHVRAQEQDGTIGTYEILIPRLKFTGTIDFSFSADGVSSTNISGTALSYTDTGSCGQQKYADWTFIPDTAGISAPVAIASVPSKISIAENATITPAIYGIRGGLYSNELLTDKLTFASSNTDCVTVNETTGLITGVAAGNANITVTYDATGLNLGTVIPVTVAAE
jgi:hypothetical protein